MNAEHGIEEKPGERRARLEKTREFSILPWVKSHEPTTYHLYWMPFTMPRSAPRQRQWVLAFVERLEQQLALLSQAEPAFFLQMKVIQEHLSEPFFASAREVAPLLGLSRRPGAPLPKLPDENYIKDLQTGRIKYDHQALQPDYCYHFLFQNMRTCMSQFFGVGGSSVLFLPPDQRDRAPAPRVPDGIKNDPAFAPLLDFARVDDMLGAVHRMQSPVFPRSRLLFGRGLEDQVQARGLTFIVPLLSVAAFQEASAIDTEEWFSFFDAALVESPQDGGLVLASRFDLDKVLDELVSQLKQEKMDYAQYL